MASSLSLVEKHPAIWRGSEAPVCHLRRLATGFLHLDDAILGGFPEYGVVRIRSCIGIGELSLLQNIFSQMGEDAFYLFINPPGRLLPQSLSRVNVPASKVSVVNTSAELSLWATEEGIKSASCSVIILWCEYVTASQARRLQVAAAQHECLVLIFEPASQRTQPLPVPLDLSLSALENGLHVNVLKLQGGWPKSDIFVPLRYTPNNDAISLMMRKYASHNEDSALHG